MNNSKSHSKKGAHEELHLKSSATQTVCEQPGYSQTNNTVQTLSELPGYFPHFENVSQTVCEQPAYSNNAATTVQTESELSGYSSLTTQAEEFYHEIADEESTRTSPVTEQRPVQLRNLAHSNRHNREKVCLVVWVTIATLIILTVPIALIHVLRQPLDETAAATPDTLIPDSSLNHNTPGVLNTSKPAATGTSPTAKQILTSALVSPSRNSSTKFRIFLPELDVDILSVASDGQLLLGESNDKQLHVYSDTGSFVKSLAVPFNDKVIDGVWSPREHHIVCTTDDTSKVVLMSASGDVVHQTEMSVPRYLSVSADNDIYVTSLFCIYYSTDNGTTWNTLFNRRGNSWRFHQALKVAPNGVLSNYTVWTIETNKKDWRLSIYTPDKRIWTDVVLPDTQVKVNHSRMSFDGHTNIYMTDWYNEAVHVWSVNGRYVRQLLSQHNITKKPGNVAVNKQNTVLYLATTGGFVNVIPLQK